MVTVNVARRLGDRKPELVTEALEFAEWTGRETEMATHRLGAVMPDGSHRGMGYADARPMTGCIQELVAGFGRLGRPIATEIPDDLSGSAAEVVARPSPVPYAAHPERQSRSTCNAWAEQWS